MWFAYTRSTRIKVYAATAIALGVVSSPFVVIAQIPNSTDLTTIADKLNLAKPATLDPMEVIIKLVQYVLTFTALLAVVVIIYGGFLWMTAAGNEDQVNSAKKTLRAGVIGLMIILGAYAIISVVITTISTTLFAP